MSRDLKITYNGKTLVDEKFINQILNITYIGSVSISKDYTKTLQCKDKYMRDNIVVSSWGLSKDITIECGNKIMLDDVSVKLSQDDRTYITSTINYPQTWGEGWRTATITKLVVGETLKQAFQYKDYTCSYITSATADFTGIKVTIKNGSDTYTGYLNQYSSGSYSIVPPDTIISTPKTYYIFN